MSIATANRLNCPRKAGARCPTSPCPGASDPGVCAHVAALDAWRALSDDEQATRSARRPAIDPAVRDAVNACPHRGPVLPVSQQPECGCAELSECRSGRGARPGRVTLRECLDCQGQGCEGT